MAAKDYWVEIERATPWRRRLEPDDEQPMTKRILIFYLTGNQRTLVLESTDRVWQRVQRRGRHGPGHGLDPVVLAGVAVMLIIAKLGGELFERYRQPAVLGELIGGIFIGNLRSRRHNGRTAKDECRYQRAGRTRRHYPAF